MNTALLFVFTVFSLISFLAILVGADPYSAGLLIQVLFFLTLFFSLAGVFSISGIWISKIGGGALAFEIIFRRSVFLAMLASSLVLLETFSVLNIANASAAFLFVVSIELLFVHKKT